MTVNHPHAMFRSGTRWYTARPPAGCRAARRAWDFFAKDGPIVWMSLLDGYWGCERPNGKIDEIENTVSDRYCGRN